MDDVIREMLQEVFSNAKGVRESDLVDKRYADQMQELTVQLKKAKTDYSKKSKELSQLDGMLMGAVDGTGIFTPERLARRMDAVEAELV